MESEIFYRLAWAVSGRGMMLRALIEANAQLLLRTPVSLVITDRPSEIEVFAADRGIGVARNYWAEMPDGFHENMRASLRDNGIDFLGLTFNRLLEPKTISQLEGRVLNVHMSLLPAFSGFGAVRNALSSGVKKTGATLHLVDAGIDTGPIVAQVSCPVLEGDTELSLGRRTFESGLLALLQTMRAIENGELKVDRGLPRWVSQAGSQLNPKLDADVRAFVEEFCRKL